MGKRRNKPPRIDTSMGYRMSQDYPPGGAIHEGRAIRNSRYETVHFGPGWYDEGSYITPAERGSTMARTEMGLSALGEEIEQEGKQAQEHVKKEAKESTRDYIRDYINRKTSMLRQIFPSLPPEIVANIAEKSIPTPIKSITDAKTYDYERTYNRDRAINTSQ